MAKSRLHELSEHGQSVWIDSLSRQWLRDGTMRKLIDEDAVVGVTSNPTIFQKALSRGRLVRRAAAGADPGRGGPEGDLLAARGRRHHGGLRPLPPDLGRRQGPGRLRLARGRARHRVRHRRDDRAGAEAARVGRQAEPVREDPGDRARARRDRGVHRARQVDQRDADLLARALRGGRAGVHSRARAARRGRRRPVARRVGRVVLRLARRHRGGQAPRRRRSSRS